MSAFYVFLEEMDSDLVIVGAGPSSLALATILVKYGERKIIIVDRDTDIGGCHRVMRIRYKDSELFTEHGPRVYSTIYQTFESILKEMGYDFHDFFVDYNFDIGNDFHLDLHEYWALILGLLSMLVSSDYGQDMSMKQFLDSNAFSNEIKEYIDRLCKFSDGAGIDRYTVYEFLNMINQHQYYHFLQPKRPNDKGLFKAWREYLEEHGVRFLMNHELLGFHGSDNVVRSAVIQDVQSRQIKDISGRYFIVAIPPECISDVLEKNDEMDIKNAFGNIEELKAYAKQTEYNDYISVQLHWSNKFKVTVKGNPVTPWDIIFMPLSNYMDVSDEPYSKTLVSCAVTSLDKRSPVSGKSANESTLDELKSEVSRQVLEVLKDQNLDPPTVITVSNNLFWDKKEEKWHDLDTAWIRVPGVKFMPQESLTMKNLYNVGCQNGYQKYAFTALESAVSNAVALAHKLEPQSKKDFHIISPFTLIDSIRIFLFIVVLVVLIILIRLFRSRRAA